MKKQLAVLAASSLILGSQPVLPAHASPIQATLLQDGTWSKYPNVVMQIEENVVGKSADQTLEYYRSAIQFRLPGITGKTVKKATLRIHVTGINSSDQGETPFLTVYGSTEDTWSDTFPLKDTDRDLETKSGAELHPDQLGWVEFDVTDFVGEQAAGQQPNDIVSFALRANESFGGPYDSMEILYSSDDAFSNHPELVLELEDAAPPLPANNPIVTNTVTAEDTKSTSGLEITADNSNGVTTNFYRISEITGGALFRNDGTTPIANNSFIPAAEGLAGLKFMPNAHENGTSGFGFQVQAATLADGSGLSGKVPASITVTEVNDAPTATDDILEDIDEDTPVRIPISKLLANDSAGPNESGQTLKVTLKGTATGGTVIQDGTDIAFTPDPDYNGPASFRYEIEDNGTTDGAADPKTAEGTASFSIRSVADVPSVTDAATDEDTYNSNGLKIVPNSVDGSDIAFFKISNIQGGTLYKNDRTTPIANNSFITKGEGDAGLYFLPDPDLNSDAGDTFSFDVQASLDDQGTGLSQKATATITVNAVNDPPHVADDLHLGPVAINSGEFLIPAAKLLENDDAGASNETDDSIRIVQAVGVNGGTVRLESGGANVTFTPAAGFSGEASFLYKVEDQGGLRNEALVTVDVLPNTDRPIVDNATTEEDTVSTSGLVLTPGAAGGSPTTHFKITGITGGILFMTDGVTPINDGDFITVAEGGAGLKFKPLENGYGDTGFGFRVQAAADETGTLLSEAVEAAVTVTEVNDEPQANNDTLSKVKKGTPLVGIDFSGLIANDAAGPENERDQTLMVTDVTSIQGGEVELANGRVEFKPDENFTGTAMFTYTVTDNGRTHGHDDPKTATATASFIVADEDQPVITLSGDQVMYLLKGDSYQEPGYSAEDETDGDLTNEVTVTGSVNTDAVGTYVLHYNVADKSNNQAPEVTRTVQVVSNALSSLTVDSEALTPDFDPNHEAYTLTVPGQKTSVLVSGSTEDPTATLTVNGIVSKGTALRSVKLDTGENQITIVVTANGGATKTYDVEITREALEETKPVIDGVEEGRTYDRDVTITFNEGAAALNGQPFVNGTTVSENGTYTIVVTDDAGNQSIVHFKINKVATVPGPSNSSGSSGGSGNSASTGSPAGNTAADSGFAVVINGVKQEQIATAATSQEGNKTTVTATLDNAKLENQLARLGQNPVVIVPITTTADKVSAVLTGESVKALENKQGTLRIETPFAAYEIPADLVSVDQLAAQLGHAVPLNEITMKVVIAASATEKAAQLERAGGRQGFTLAETPVDFSIEAAYGGNTVEVDKFDAYVQREIVLPAGADPSKITTAVVLNADGTVHHVPTSVTVRDGKYFAAINSLTNSTYGLIWNQKTFADVQNHWSKEAVEDMASRLVVNGIDDTHYNPNASVTRAEFAALIVRGLGLAEAEGTDRFKDVKSTDWYSGAVQKAVEYNLVKGYEDGTFAPNKTMTREEALTMISRAMEVVDKQGVPAAGNSSLAQFADSREVGGWAANDVAKTVESGLVQGKGNKLEPKTKITRAETATLIQRLLLKFGLIDKK